MEFSVGQEQPFGDSSATGATAPPRFPFADATTPGDDDFFGIPGATDSPAGVRNHATSNPAALPAHPRRCVVHPESMCRWSASMPPLAPSTLNRTPVAATRHSHASHPALATVKFGLLSQPLASAALSRFLVRMANICPQASRLARVIHREATSSVGARFPPAR